MKINNKTLTAFFFQLDDEDSNCWRCNKCYPVTGKVIKNKRSTGYTNLVNHLRSCVGDDYQEKMKAHLDASGVTIAAVDKDGKPSFSQRVIDNFCCYSDKEQRAYAWMRS